MAIYTVPFIVPAGYIFADCSFANSNLLQSSGGPYIIGKLTTPWLAYWHLAIQTPILRITNSAGFTGAIPITQINRPLSMSFCVIVSRPHLTKNASSGFVPCSPPALH